MVKASELIIGIILLGLFSLTLVNFAINVSEDNNAPILNQSGEYAGKFEALRVNLTRDLNSTDTSFESQKSGFFGVLTEIPVFGDFFAVLKVMLGTLKVIGSVVTGIYDLTLGLIYDVFSIPTIIQTVMNAILVLVIIFVTWRSLKTGD